MPALRQHLDAVAKRLAAAGAQVSEVTLPREFGEIHAAGQVILESEAAAYHEAMFAKHGADYGPGFAAMMPIGLKRSAVEYVVANRARHAFRDAVIPLLEAHDALLSPTALGPAPAGLGWTGDASLCAPWSSAGVPSISIPTVWMRPACRWRCSSSRRRPISSGCSAWPRGARAWSGSRPSREPDDVRPQDRRRHGDRRHRARPGSRADIGIRDETIVAVGDLSRETAGKCSTPPAHVVTPGFIDMHSHSDWRLWGNRRAESKIRQGVTTEVVGNCGFSPAPVATEFVEDLRASPSTSRRGWTLRGARSANICRRSTATAPR